MCQSSCLANGGKGKWKRSFSAKKVAEKSWSRRHPDRLQRGVSKFPKGKLPKLKGLKKTVLG